MEHPERYALALAAIVLTTAVAACGSGSSSPGTTGSGAGAGAAITGAGRGRPEGRQAHRPGRRRRRLPRPGPVVLRVRPHGQLPPSTASSTTTSRATAVGPPDLATGPPKISPDGKTITVSISTGVRYAPPVDREVAAEDVKYAMERAFSANVPSGYAHSYFKTIVGAPQKPGRSAHPAASRRPTTSTLVIKLTEPEAPLVSQALAMPITVPVPEEYAAKFDRKTPSTYDQYVAFTGPYMVKHDLEGGLDRPQAGQAHPARPQSELGARRDFRPAYLDAIDIEEGNGDATVASRRVLQGTGMVQGDGAAAGGGDQAGADAVQRPDPVRRRPAGTATSR